MAQTVKEVDREIVDLETMQVLTRVYGEIASMRMKRTRDEVLQNREFVTGVNRIFQDIMASYRAEVVRLIRERSTKRAEGGLTLLAHNGRAVAVYLSANNRFYGPMIRQTFDMFIREVREGGAEATIVGRTGRGLFVGSEPNRPYTYFDYPDNGEDLAKLAELMAHIVQYERVHVYYGKFINAVVQKASVFDISSESPLSKLQGDGEIEKIKYVFEPNLESILKFFESEMFGSLLGQIISESQLSKSASRILAMNDAGVNVSDGLKKVKQERFKLAHRVENRAQQAGLAGISLWGK